MKNKLISHIVTATTEKRKLVLLITLILCILSIISIIYFTEIDLSLKGLVGDDTSVVKEFNELMGQFNISGMINIVLEPNPEKMKLINIYKEEIIDLIYYGISEETKYELISILKDYENSFIFEKITVEYIVVDTLVSISSDKREEIFNDIEDLEERERKDILKQYERISSSNLNKEKLEDAKEELRRETYLYREMIIKKTLDRIDFFSELERNDLVKNILYRISVLEKIIFVEESESLPVDKKEELLEKLMNIEENISNLLSDFLNLAESYSDELKSGLLSDKEISYRNRKLSLNEYVKAVLYSKELSLSKDGLMYMLLIQPKKDVSDVSDSKLFATIIDKQIDLLDSSYQDKLVVRRTGYSVVAVDQERSILNNFDIMMIVNICGIFLIFFVGLRRLIYPILSFIPLIIGILLMYGIYSFSIRTINIVTLIEPILQFGIGIDYAIHFGARYGELRKIMGKDASQKDILIETFNSIGLGLGVASITTMLAFLSLITASITGLRHFGFLASIGILTSFLSMFYLLPIIITWRERKFKKQQGNFLSGKKFTRLGHFVESNWGKTIAVIIVIFSISSIIFIPNIEIEREQDKLNPQNLESIKTGKEIGKKYNSSYSYTFFVVKGYDSLKTFVQEMNRDKNGKKLYSTINTARSISAYRAIKEFETYGWDRNPDTISKYKDEVSKGGGLLGINSKKLVEYYEFLLRNFVDWEEEEFLILVNSNEYVWYEEYFDAHMKELNELEKRTDSISAGVYEIWEYILENMLSDLILFSLSAFVIILIILLVMTKSIRGTLLCSLSLLISILSTLSIISLIGMKLNFINILAFPLIMGLGIDYSVHIYYRLMDSKSRSIVDVISSTGKAILMTTLTTLMAFGTVSFSIQPGIASQGRLVCIGLVISFLSSVFILPLAFVKMLKK